MAAREVLERESKSYWGMGARECDSCKVSPALLFCRADSAFLCGTCDSKVHGVNKLASRHERVWMCEVCEQAPAAVTCKADAAALCVTCDADIHSANPLARRHERFPVAPFFHSPNNLNPNPNSDEDADVDTASWDVKPSPDPAYFFSDVDPYLDLDYAASMDPRFHQTDSVVPVNKVGSTVPHPAPVFAGGGGGSFEIDFTAPKPSYSYAPSLSHSVSSSEVGVVPDGSAMTDISNPYVGSAPVAAAAVVGMDREARVLRYREKRKNRRFEKTIRYASRKAYAETRPRIKGRFAKRTELDADVMFSPPAVGMDSGYGVVPSY